MSEHIYQAAIIQSALLAKADGVYETFKGSPTSRGVLQFDMWPQAEPRLDWREARELVATHGLRNSLLTAYRPTASTAQICGVAAEGFEVRKSPWRFCED